MGVLLLSLCFSTDAQLVNLRKKIEDKRIKIEIDEI